MRSTMRLDIKHHLDPSTLMAYSAGTLGEALSAVASAHIEMCPLCRKEMRGLDMVGALMLEAMAVEADAGMTPPASMPAAGTVVALPRRARAAIAAPAATDPPSNFARRTRSVRRNIAAKVLEQ